MYQFASHGSLQLGEPLADWLTQKTVSTRLNISERTLERMRHEGTGPPFTKAGRKVLYRANHVEQWLANRSFVSTAEDRRQTLDGDVVIAREGARRVGACTEVARPLDADVVSV